MGMLGDRLAATTCILISSVGSAIAVFVFWELNTHIAMLTIFTILYGFFAGGFSSTWPGILQEMKKEHDAVDTGVIMGLLLGGRGIGNVISGPVSVSLLEHAWSLGGGWGFSTKHGPVILFTGVTAVFGAWGWMWKVGRQMTA